MPSYAPPMVVAAPAVVVPKYGLYSVAAVVDDPRGAALGVIYTTTAVSSGAATGWIMTNMCGSNPLPQTVGADVTTVTGLSFWVGTEATCLLDDDMSARAHAELAIKEEHLVETAFLNFLAALPVTASLPTSTAVMVAGAFESALHEAYRSLGAIILPRSWATPLAAQLHTAGGKALTLLETPIAFMRSTGADPKVARPVAVVGDITIRRGAVEVSTVTESLNRTTDDIRVVAQRPITITWDGFARTQLATAS